MATYYIPQQDFVPGDIVNEEYILCQHLYKDIPAPHICVKKKGDIDMTSIWAHNVFSVHDSRCGGVVPPATPVRMV